MDVPLEGFSLPHHLVGLVVMALGIQQPINGFLRAHVHEGQAKSTRRIWWERAHIWGGRLMLVLGMSNVLAGFMLLPSPDFVVGLYAAWFAAIVLFHVGMEVRRYFVFCDGFFFSCVYLLFVCSFLFLCACCYYYVVFTLLVYLLSH
jgi:hypothetical protein